MSTHSMALARPPIPLCRGLYVVSTAAHSAGDLIAITLGREAVRRPRSWKGRKCWEVFEGRAAHCPGCPAFELKLAPGHAQTGVLENSEGPFTVVHVQQRRRTARVTAIPIPEEVLVQLVRGKLQRLMSAARLSQKERGVFELLLLGRQTRDIAAVVGTSSRTVKFHVTNILLKLSADSRLDLLRKLVLTTGAVDAR